MFVAHKYIYKKINFDIFWIDLVNVEQLMLNWTRKAYEYVLSKYSSKKSIYIFIIYSLYQSYLQFLYKLLSWNSKQS